MKYAKLTSALVCAALAACNGGRGSGDQPQTRDGIRVVGSSTVYPFTTAVAERFAGKGQGRRAPVVESTGTGGGFKLFCAGVGANHPDIANASRRIKKSEYDQCVANGAGEIVELEIGIDGISFGESKEGPALALTIQDIYRALAANPYGKPNTAKTWRDVNPALPATPIQVMGPPSTSGTRDALVELILIPACDSDPAMKALKKSDEDKHKEICTKVRDDGPYIDSGENDNLIVQKLVSNPNAIGLFGFSFLEANMDRLRGVSIAGVEPSYDSILTYKYPGARPLYIYVKKAHLKLVEGLGEYVSEYASAWGPDGYLKGRGLIVAPEQVRSRSEKIAADMTPLDPKTLK